MGQVFSDSSYKWWIIPKKPRIKILMLHNGINGAGRTTILYYLLLGEVIKALPTHGCNVEKLKYENKQYEIRDFGSGARFRPPWRYYFHEAKGIIFVVDSNDRKSISEVKDELDFLLKDEALKNIPLLIYANKQDLPKAMTALELVDHLGLRSVETRRWHVQYSCAIRGEGLWEGFKWLTNEITKENVKF